MSTPTVQDVANAMAAFAPMLGTLTSYARAMLGNEEVQVTSGSRTMTDGEKIIIRPPLALARTPRHERERCGSRGQYGTLSCPACAVHEDILVKVRHEIAHIAHGSFERVIYRQSSLDTLAQDTRLPHALITAPRRGQPIMGWASSSPDPMIGTLVMVLEDVRIDLLNGEASDGGREIYRAHLEMTLAQGVEGRRGPAIESPLDVQVFLGILSIPHGVDVEGLVSPEAVEILGDQEVRQIMETRYSRSKPVLHQAFTLYRRLIDLGVLPEPEPEQGPEGDPEQEETDDSGQAQDDDDSAGDDDPGESDPGESDPGESGGPEEGLEPGSETDQATTSRTDPVDLRELIEAATGHDTDLDGDFKIADQDMDRLVEKLERDLEHLGEPRPHTGTVRVYGTDTPDGPGPLYGRSRRPETLRAQDPPEATLGPLVGRARIVFSDNAAIKRQRDARRGRVSPTTLGKRAWNPDDHRLFERRQRPNAPSYSVLVGMDNSGSTAGSQIATILRETALAAGIMCQRVGVEVAIYAHTTTGTDSIDLYQVKRADAPWRPGIGRTLRNLDIGATNFDGSTMTVYRRLLAARPATRKVLLYFTDGEIPGTGGASEEQIMRDEVHACRRAGITLLGVGAQTMSPEEFGIPTVSLDSQQDVGKVLEFLSKEFGV